MIRGAAQQRGVSLQSRLCCTYERVNQLRLRLCDAAPCEIENGGPGGSQAPEGVRHSLGRADDFLCGAVTLVRCFPSSLEAVPSGASWSRGAFGDIGRVRPPLVLLLCE